MNARDGIQLAIEELEERIAPTVLANPAALPPDNPGTTNAVGAGATGREHGSFTDRWFGKAADR